MKHVYSVSLVFSLLLFSSVAGAHTLEVTIR